MGTKRGLERIIFFTDAVTAIAITLLILPLVEVITSLHHEGGQNDFIRRLTAESRAG
jgi:uncharacterized membrane protein